MTILKNDDLSTALANAMKQSKPASENNEREKAKVWLNVGVNLPGAGEDGGDLFISLPVGIPLDTMKPQEVRGNKASWIQLVQAKNGLLDMLQKAATGLEPGSNEILPQLSVQILRVGQPEQVGDEASNPLLAALSSALK